MRSDNLTIVILDDDGVKKCIGDKNGETVKPLCIILPQMSGFIKYFESNNKNVLFLADDDVILKYNKIWKNVKKLLSTEFDSQLVYDETCIKTRVKLLRTKLFQNLQSIKSLEKILVILVLLQFVLILQ